VADDDDVLQPEFGDHRLDVGAEGGDGPLLAVGRRGAVAGKIHRDDAETFGQCGDLLGPVALITHPAVHQDQVRLVDAVDGVGDLDAVRRGHRAGPGLRGRFDRLRILLSDLPATTAQNRQHHEHRKGRESNHGFLPVAADCTCSIVPRRMTSL
jgi:hypothetical protein